MPKNPLKRLRKTASSSQGGPSSSQTSLPPRLISESAKKWYEEREHSGMVIERTLSEELDNQLSVSSIFQNMGWERLINLSGIYYPTLVKEFFANMRDKNAVTSRVIYTQVKGVDITLTHSSLARMLGISDEGDWIVLNSKKLEVTSDPEWNFQEAFARLGLFYRAHVKKRILPADELSPQYRVALYLIVHNIAPRSSSYNEVRLVDVYLLDKMMSKTPIPLAALLIANIYVMCYPLLITYILQKCGVSFAGEQVAQTTDSEIITTLNLQHCGYKFREATQEWLKPREELLHRGIQREADLPVELEPRPAPSGFMARPHFQEEVRHSLDQLHIRQGQQQAQLDSLNRRQEEILHNQERMFSTQEQMLSTLSRIYQHLYPDEGSSGGQGGT